MDSVRAFRKAFPTKTILADMKTFDNAAYEMKLCFEAGANVATVMGAAPFATLEMCKRVADEYGRHIMVDLLNVQADQHHHLARLTSVIRCYHVSKDEQERQGKSASTLKIADGPTGVQTAVAGGITVESIPRLKRHGIDVIIVGSAITRADNPLETARQIIFAIDNDKTS